VLLGRSWSAARDQIAYNGVEPDRWRMEGPTSAMNVAQAPDHFFDSELWGCDSKRLSPIATLS
jgi:hypothetical protein